MATVEDPEPRLLILLYSSWLKSLQNDEACGEACHGPFWARDKMNQDDAAPFPRHLYLMQIKRRPLIRLVARDVGRSVETTGNLKVEWWK
jgi:hypothetical protein